MDEAQHGNDTAVEVRVRRMHRRDINRTWEFLKHVFRDVNRETVEYQRPRTKQRFEDIYDDENIEQLLFEVGDQIVGCAECSVEVAGDESKAPKRPRKGKGAGP